MSEELNNKTSHENNINDSEKSNENLTDEYIIKMLSDKFKIIKK